MRAALVLFLKADPGVSAIIGTRLFPFGRTPQDADFPHLTYFQVDGVREGTLSGPDGRAHPRFQIDCCSLDQLEATTLATAVRNATGGAQGSPVGSNFAKLHGFKGTMGGVTVQQAEIVDERDIYDEPEDASDVGVARVVLDLVLVHEESQ